MRPQAPSLLLGSIGSIGNLLAAGRLQAKMRSDIRLVVGLGTGNGRDWQRGSRFHVRLLVL